MILSPTTTVKTSVSPAPIQRSPLANLTLSASDPRRSRIPRNRTLATLSRPTVGNSQCVRAILAAFARD